MAATLKCDTIQNASSATANLTLDASGNVNIAGVIDGLSTPGTATGTGSTSGGTLAAATYYVRIVAFDSAGNTTNAGTESTGVTTTGSTSSIAYTWTAVTGATGYRVYFSTTSGTYASGYFVSTSASYTLTTTSGSIAVGLPASNTTGISLMSNQSFKRNRIINGDMRIAQRGTAAITGSGEFVVDRFLVGNTTDGAFSAQQDTSAPVGFINSTKITVTTADATLTTTQAFSFQHRIEGTNISDLAWGTANALTITLSFWVRSSLTGTFGGALRNSANDRSYPFTYAISSADTWEQKSVTISGDTSGTWLTTTGIGIRLFFGLGVGPDASGTAGAWAAGNLTSATGATSVVGTNGATFYITGVQLEVGSVATPYERQIYSDQLAQCQRYYYRMKADAAGQPFGIGYCTASTSATCITVFPVTMRTSPTAVEQTGTASDYRVYTNAGTTCSSVPTIAAGSGSVFSVSTVFTVASGLTAGNGSYNQSLTSSAYLGWSAEL